MSLEEEREALRGRFFELVDRLGSVTRAAAELGVNRATAFGWMRKAGLRSPGPGGHGPHPGRQEYDRLRASGVSRRDAAQRVGVNVRSAKDWDRGVRRTGNARVYPDGRKVDYPTGVTTMVEPSPITTVDSLQAALHPRFLTLAERETIADLHRQGVSLRAIGRELGRPASTVKREIDARAVGGIYRPYAAQRSWATSRSRPKAAKLAESGPLRDYVASRLRERWSPE